MVLNEVLTGGNFPVGGEMPYPLRVQTPGRMPVGTYSIKARLPYGRQTQQSQEMCISWDTPMTHQNLLPKQTYTERCLKQPRLWFKRPARTKSARKSKTVHHLKQRVSSFWDLQMKVCPKRDKHIVVCSHMSWTKAVQASAKEENSYRYPGEYSNRQPWTGRNYIANFSTLQIRWSCRTAQLLPSGNTSAGRFSKAVPMELNCKWQKPD